MRGPQAGAGQADSSTDSQGGCGHGTHQRGCRARGRCLHCGAPKPGYVPRQGAGLGYTCLSCAAHCQGGSLTDDAMQYIINGQTFQDFIRFQGLDDVLGVLAYNGVRSWLDVSNLDKEGLFKLNARLTNAGYGVGYMAVMRAAYIGVGQTRFGGFYQQCPPWLQPGLLSSIPEYPLGLEPHFWPDS